jgi:hypothetical protein
MAISSLPVRDVLVLPYLRPLKKQGFQVQSYSNMKYSIFALFAFSLQLLVSCQNNPTADNSGAAADPSTGTVSSVSPASDPIKLNEQILTDMVAGRSFSNQFTPAYDGSFPEVVRIKLYLASQGESGIAKIPKFVEDIIKFQFTYREHRKCTDDLDALSTQLSAGQIGVEDAQKVYKTVRKQMAEAAARFPAEKVAAEKAIQVFDQTFPNAGSQQ